MNENKKDKNIENKFNKEKLRSLEKTKFLKPKIETAPKIGIEIRKDILAESTLLNFRNRAAVIPMPDLLTPGIKDKICNKPIKIADLYEKFFFIFFSNLNLSLAYSKIPKIIVVQATI